MKSVDLLKNKGVMNFTPIFLLIIVYSFLQGILFEYVFKNIVGYNIKSVLCSYIFSAIILKTSLVFFPQNEHLTSSLFLTIITPRIIELFLYLIIFLLSNRYKAQKDTHYYNIF